MLGKNKQKLNHSKISKLSLILLSTSIMVITISTLFFNPQKIEAKPKPVQMAKVWKQASFPVENFQSYTSPFGYRIHPVTGRRQFHEGLDMAAPLGSYVRSWWSGQVVGLSDHTGCGTMITIKSGKWTHSYCHLMGYVQNTDRGKVLVDRNGGIILWQGQGVPAGSRIGRVGMTGRTTGPHLHWVLRYNGKLIDPGSVLRQMFAREG